MTDHLAPRPAYVNLAHTLLRIVAAAVLMQHGAQKLFGAFGGIGATGIIAHYAVLRHIAELIELGGGTLILLGLFTRVVAFIAAGEMATAYFVQHAPHAFWPLANHGEVPVLLCFIFLYLAAVGAGPFSLDHALHRRRPARVMP